MGKDHPKRFSGIGGRTGKNVLLNKKIRKLADGKDNFSDYFSTTSEESSEDTFAGHSSVSQSPYVSTSPKPRDKKRIQEVTYSSPVRSEPLRIVIGSRSKKNILPPKSIRKLSDGRDNFDDYFTDGGSHGSTFRSAIPENSSQLHSSPASSTSKNSRKKAPTVSHSSPITRLSSSKAICNDVDNPSGSKSKDLEEEIRPSVSNTFTKKIIKSKGNARKSVHDKHDSCDAKLLKLAEDYEKSENIGDDSRLHARKEAKSNTSKKLNTPQRATSKSPLKKTVSVVSPEKHLTRSSDGTPTKSQLKKTGKKNSVKTHNHEQNISQASHSNALGSELQRSDSQQSHFDVNTVQNCDESYEVNPILEQDNALSGNNSSASKLLIKRKLNSTSNTASKKKSNSLVASSTLDRNVQASKHLLDNDLNVTFQVVDPLCLSFTSEENLKEHDSQLHGEEDSDSNLSKTLGILQEKNSKSPKKTVSFVSSEDQHHLTRSCSETSNETQSENIDDRLVKTTEKNVPRKKQYISDSNELQSNTSVHSHFDVNSATDYEKSSEENVVAPNKSTSKNKDVASKSPVKKKSNHTPASKANSYVASAKKHKHADERRESLFLSEGNGVAEKDSTPDRNINVARKSNLTPVTASKNKANSFVASAKKHKHADESKEKMFLSEENGVAENESTSDGNINVARKSPVKRKSNLTPVSASKKKANSFVASDKKLMPALNKTNKNVQHVDSSIHSDRNATFQVNNPELSLSSNKGTLRKTNKNKASSLVSAEAHENEENEHTGKGKKGKKSHENPKPKTKNKKNSVAQENEASAPCRRSSRIRVAPLEAWRNERALFRNKNGSLRFDIDPGSKEDDGSKQALAARFAYAQKREKARRKPENVPKIRFKDMVLEKQVTVPLLKKFYLFPWEGESNENAAYRIKRVVQTSNSNFGFIEIKAGKSKPLQYLPEEDIYLCLMHGKIKALIEEKEILLEEKDTLVIPRSVPYILKNYGQRKALLVYSVGRFKYLENTLF